jgi:hypothetical protein
MYIGGSFTRTAVPGMDMRHIVQVVGKNLLDAFLRQSSYEYWALRSGIPGISASVAFGLHRQAFV